MATGTATGNTIPKAQGVSATNQPYAVDAYGTGAPTATNAGNQGIGSDAGGGSGYGASGQMSMNEGGQPQQQAQSGQVYDQMAYQQPTNDPYASLFPGGQSGSGLAPGSSWTGSTMGSSTSNPYSPNPYLGAQADAIKTQYNQNLQENTLPGLRDKFVSSGGLGGSRQGIAEGLAAGRSNTGMANAITNLYANDYENSQNRQSQAALASASMGMQNQGQQLANQLGLLNSERNFYSTNRGQDLQQMGLAQGLLNNANQGFTQQGQGLYNTGLTEQNAGWNQLQNYSGLLQPYTQAGATNSGVGTQQYTYNPTQQWVGTMAQAAGAFMSDVRLKENIKRVGSTDSGLSVYTYNYKGNDLPHMGVMAQEVEQKQPEALGPTVNGFKSVRYGLLG